MFIPPKELNNRFKTINTGGIIRLMSSHLFIDHTLAEEIFRDDPNVHVIYYPDQRTLMVAAIRDDVFTSLHKASQHMLKNRNMKGDKTLALHEILIDHQINTTDRDLEYELQPQLGILKVNL